MADQWEPIRIYSYLGATKPDISITRERVVSYLNGTDPDSVEAAGKSYVEAAKLLRGEGGVQDALMRAARDLSEVWRGPSARQAMRALRLLHASAGALGEAMEKTGEPMKRYAERVRHYRSTVPDPAVAPGLVNRGLTNGQSGGGIGSDGTTPPLITGSGLNGGSSFTPLAPLADEQARQHLENLNIEIVDINLQIAEGLAFQLPEITPLTVETQQAKKLHVPEVTESSGGGGDGRWTGGGSGSEDSYGTGGSGHTGGSGTGGTGGTGSGGTGDGSNGTGSNGDGSNGTGSDGTTTPQDPGQQGQDDPSTGDDPTTQQPGTDDQQQQQQPGDQDQQQKQEEAPAVIGGPGNERTELAQTPTATQPPPTTTTPNPYTPTPNPYVSTPPTVFPNTPPGSTPYSGTGVGPWYGGGGAPATSPSVLRSTPGGGNGFMAFPPGAMGAAGQNNGDERTREYYDSEGDIWAPPVETSPDRLG